jgi:hypothetical protein
MTETTDGLTSGTNGALIYVAGLPGNYDVRSRYKLTTSGGSYVTYVRASADANLQTNTGSFYAVEIHNVTVAGGGCTAVLTLWQRNPSGTLALSNGVIACAQDMQTAVMVRDGTLVAYRPDTGQAQLNLRITQPLSQSRAGHRTGGRWRRKHTGRQRNHETGYLRNRNRAAARAQRADDKHLGREDRNAMAGHG